MELPLPDLAATERLGAMLAGLVRPGDAILLEGPLGAGKTTLARALIRAAMADPCLDVPSPTFMLLQTYEAGILAIHHLDLWRLHDARALVELGWDELQAGVVIVEWPDRLGEAAPRGALRIVMVAGEQAERRHAHLEGWPAWRLRQCHPSG